MSKVMNEIEKLQQEMDLLKTEYINLLEAARTLKELLTIHSRTFRMTTHDQSLNETVSNMLQKFERAIRNADNSN